MTYPDDFDGEMFGVPLDGETVDAILEGRMVPDDAPEGLQQVASFVQMARRAALPEELAGEAEVVAQIAAAVGSHDEVVTAPDGKRAPVLTRLRKAHLERVVPVVAVAVLGGGAAAAAATGGFSPSHQAPSRILPHSQSVASVAAHSRAHRHLAHVVDRRATGSHARRIVLTAHTTPTNLVAGKVTAVNGVTAAGTCGSAGVAGAFTVSEHWSSSSSATVDVTPTTTFSDPAAGSASFGNLCVGDYVRAAGTSSSGTLMATKVFVFTPPASPTPSGQSVVGKVTAVNGSTTSGTCGTAGSTGSFTVTTGWGSWSKKSWGSSTTTTTVDVTTSTTFVDRSDSTPSFADVCVGDPVFAHGTESAGTLTATLVAVGSGGCSGSGHDHGRHDPGAGWSRTSHGSGSGWGKGGPGTAPGNSKGSGASSDGWNNSRSGSQTSTTASGGWSGGHGSGSNGSGGSGSGWGGSGHGPGGASSGSGGHSGWGGNGGQGSSGHGGPGGSGGQGSGHND